MKLRLLILLAAALAASPAAGQTIKSLGYNTTNGVVPTSLSTNTLRFTNAEGLQFNKLTTANMVLGTNGVMTFYTTNSGFDFSAGATAAQFCDDLGLGATNAVTFGTLTAEQLQVKVGTNLYVGLADDVSEFWTDVAVNETLSVSGSATFATNVTVGGTLAVTGNVTLSGSDNLMPNATNAASASSLMTRSLTDLQMFGLLGLYDPVRLASGTVTGTNGGGFDNYGSSYDLRTGTNAAGTVVYNAGGFTRQTTAGSAANAAWANRIVVAWPFNRNSTNNEVRLQYGRSTSANTHGALTARGIGIRINGNNMFFETHDGTTAFETTDAVPLTHNFGQDVFWAISESGVVRFYRGQNTLLATVTNNAPTNGVSDNNTGWIISISNTAAANSIFRVQNNPGFVLQQ